MNNLIRKKVILCLLDSEPKSADAIADEIDQSLTAVDDRLTGFVLPSESSFQFDCNCITILV